MRPARLVVAAAVLLLATSGTSGARPPATVKPAAVKPATVKLIFSGDVMLGRGVAPLAATDPNGVFGGVAVELRSADFTVSNLESPLTNRPHRYSHGPNALEARPASARILATAGFDAMAIANNHAGDAGPKTVPDTMRALGNAQLGTIGAGANIAAAYTPYLDTIHGVRIAFLSFDDTGEGPRAGPAEPGVAWWDPARVRPAVTRARAEADVVVVGLHGGSDYDPTTDPWLLHLGRLLAAWGADVVWGTGPHVVQPTELIRGRGARTTVVATSLGNLVFDQYIPGTRTGELLEVLVGRNGVRAYRLGATAQEESNAVDFRDWRQPHGDAAALDGEWWSLAGKVTPARSMNPGRLRGFPGHVVAAGIGDPEGNGSSQLAVSFWRPYRRTDVNALIPRARLVNRHGLTSHVGIYEPGDRAELWVAGTLLEPVVRLAACDGALAVAYSTLNGSSVVGASAWEWRGFGFSPLPELTGRGSPGCADVDGDGRLDPVILGRTSR
jgi:poly-gamma-glutamate capsule biosynthesis protein CapA/YwtB (metallophosphatase superfamily)